MTCKTISRRAFLGTTAVATIAAATASHGLTAAPAIADSAEGETKTITDMRDREVEVPVKVDRLIAIGCAQRFACYLGAAGKLIGVEESDQEDAVACTYRHVYHDLLAALPITGDGGSNGALVNEEAILAADPQMILCDSMDVDSCDQLQRRTGIPVVALDQPESVFDEFYYRNVLVAGEALGVPERAQEIVDYIKGVKSDIEERLVDADKDITAYACGISYRGGHGFDGTEARFPPFQVCGITNIADGEGLDGPYTIDVEAVITAQPQFIFIECGNLDLVKEDYDKSPAAYEALDAVEAGNTNTIISHRWYSTNVELALANCYQVAHVLFPEELADVDPVAKLDEICAFLLDAECCSFFDDHKMSEDLAEAGYEFKQVIISEL